MKEKLRIGIAVDTLELPAWKNHLIKKIEENDFSILGAILLPNTKEREPINEFSFWKWHMQLDAKYFKPKPNAFQRIKNDAFLKNSHKFTCNDIESLKKSSLDLILWLSDIQPESAIYKELRIGVLYFTNGEDGMTSEDFLGYQEFVKMAEVITSALMIQSNTEDPAQEIYRTWSMMPTLSISRSRNEHMWKLVSLVPRAINEIHAQGSTTFFKKIKQKKANQFSSGPRNNFKKQNPSSFTALINISSHFIRMGLKAMKKIAYKEQWILLLNMQQGGSTSFIDFKKILPPKDRFWADPFLVEKDKKQYLFIEELPFATDKGHLSVMEINENGEVSQAVKILDKPYHLSYPFIFEYSGTYYMIPESYEDKNIQLYECIEFPFHWEHKMNLMTGLDAFDTTLYFYNNKWWMFTLISEQKGGGHNDELFLFYADSPFTTEWKSHPGNPIVSDVRLARPAGNLYEEDGKLIRPSQDCAKKYGYGFNLNEIEVLTETEYRERRLLNVRPDWDKSLSRTHSFNHLPGITVIDAVIQRSRFF